jgi:hypothetical protein
MGGSHRINEYRNSAGINLGPLLFLIYVNCLPSFIQTAAPSNASVADDTNIITIQNKLRGP